MFHVLSKLKNTYKSLNGAGICRILISAFCVLFLWNCASLSPKKDVLAVVDDERITGEDIVYALQIEHRREDLSSARKLDIKQYIQRIIDEKLLVQEALRMGMEDLPEVQSKVQAYLLRESVMKLYDEEIVRRVSVSEKEIRNNYRKNYERVSLGIIEVDSEEKAGKILESLKLGNDFTELARQHSTHYSEENKGEVAFPVKDAGFLKKAIADLRTGELSDVVKIRQKYYIVKLIDRQEAPDADFEKSREGIRRQIKSRKTEERSAKYLVQLRERADLEIDKDVLASIDLESGKDKKEELLTDKRPIVTLSGSVLSVGDLVAMLPQNKNELIEKSMNSWIDRKLVDHEALSRHYEVNTDLKDMLLRYKNQLLKKTFINKALMTRIKISEKDMEDYYLDNKRDFMKPVSYRVQQLSVKTADEAEDILKNLKEGASFSWLAEKKSVDPYAEKGGNAGWMQKGQLSENAKEIIGSLEPGGISPVFEAEGLYRIIRLQERTKEEFELFSKVRPLVHRKVFGKKYAELYGQYVSELKEKAQIVIYDEKVRVFEEMFGK